jgi:N-acetyl-gamma-glutamyl-phosphate reductase
MVKVFIDGREGTTGLRIYERIAAFSDIELLVLGENERKDPAARKKMIAASDITFLCLPDDAARESVRLAEGSGAKIIDTSTAHRTDPDWSYGFAELSPAHEAAVKNGRRVAVPGCHASGFIALVYPLVAAGILPPDCPLTCFSVTGYRGGGKKRIAEYEPPGRAHALDAPRQYALSQNHKHLKEMKAISGLSQNPVFCPIVADFYSGMVVTVPVFPALFKKPAGPQDVLAIFAQAYAGKPLMTVLPYTGENGMLDSNALEGRDTMEIAVHGAPDRLLLTARFDNLGKGASGAAVQCMNLMLGRAETDGLVL